MSKLSIVPIDDAVYVDGQGFNSFDFSEVPDDVHALQWQDTSGWIERKSQADEVINELPQWATGLQEQWNLKKQESQKPPVVIPPTDDELKANNAATAKDLLRQCDWTQARDVTLANDNLWVAYRQALRAIVNQPQPNSVFPVAPPEQWIP